MSKLHDIANPEIMLLLTEAYEKEIRLRAFWVNKHTEQILLAATLGREPANYFEQDVIKSTMEEAMATISRDHKDFARNRKKTPVVDAKSIQGIKNIRHENSLINLGVGDAKEDPRLARPDTDLSPDPIMRPIDSKTKRILFKPQPDFGREKYLNTRAKQLPEKRYYLPECVSWDHGWRLCDSKMNQISQFGRHWDLQKALKNRVGLARDPDDYKSGIQGSFQKCP